MLEDTLIVWGGEFGRTAYCQGKLDQAENYGRDHHPRCFTVWMAGGGIKPGITYGRKPMTTATTSPTPTATRSAQSRRRKGARPGLCTSTTSTRLSCHLLGIDHTRLTYRYQGRDFRLTDVHGHVMGELVV